ncbi:MAG: hypothetical protein ACXW30_05280 [Micavibrio sp.]
MRLTAFIIAVITMLPFSAVAQTAISSETANTYYKKCMQNDDERMSDATQESLCSCTAVKMMSVITNEDIVQMSPEPGPGRPAFDKMLADAYGPCMQIPVEEQLHTECMNDPKIKEFALRDQSALCRCMAKTTTQSLEIQAPAMMRTKLEEKPGLTDAFDPLAYDKELRSRAYDNLFLCLKEGN